MKLEVTTLRVVLDGATTTTTSSVVKWYGSIVTHQNLGKNNGKDILGSRNPRTSCDINFRAQRNLISPSLISHVHY